LIDVPNIFLQVVSNTPENIDGNQRATYILTRSPTENSFGGSMVQFTLSVKSLTAALFATYGNTANKSIIQSYVRVSGVQSGSVIDVNVSINQNL
jgi:hypothetical protein